LSRTIFIFVGSKLSLVFAERSGPPYTYLLIPVKISFSSSSGMDPQTVLERCCKGGRRGKKSEKTFLVAKKITNFFFGMVRNNANSTTDFDKKSCFFQAQFWTPKLPLSSVEMADIGKKTLKITFFVKNTSSIFPEWSETTQILPLIPIKKIVFFKLNFGPQNCP